MSNILKYPNLKPFNKGHDPRRRIEGRPKKLYVRDKYTDELFNKHKENGDLEKAVAILFEEAVVERKPYALTLVCNIFLTRPKNDENVVSEEDDANDFTEKLKTIPKEKLLAAHKILSEELEVEQ